MTYKPLYKWDSPDAPDHEKGVTYPLGMAHGLPTNHRLLLMI